jgi:hypothetical protein
MADRSDDHDRGLAERSVNTSIVPPRQDSSAPRKQGDRAAGERIPENEQREGLEKTDHHSLEPDDR